MKEPFYQYRTTENKIDNMTAPFKLLSMNSIGRNTICLLGFLALSASSSTAATLDDLKKLDCICFVPSYLPNGFKLKSVEITEEDVGPDEGKTETRKVKDYAIEWSDGKRSFSIESAAEGIGDRNIMEEEDTEETEVKSPFGPLYLIYRPKGKDGAKVEIRANWVEDENLKKENAAKGENTHPVLGRFHGFTGEGISVAEFQKIVNSLHPVKEGSKPDKPKETGGAPELKLHPKIFNLIQCWISDVESPVVTEINLDAVDKNGNEFNDDGLKVDGQWTKCPNPDSKEGFMWVRVLESKGNHYKVEYQENGGGTLTTASIIEFDIQKRNIQRDGKPMSIRVLHVTSYADKK